MTGKNCTIYRDEIPALVMDLVEDEQQVSMIEDHLTQCDRCRQLYQVMLREEEMLQKAVESIDPVVSRQETQFQLLTNNFTQSNDTTQTHKSSPITNRWPRMVAAGLILVGMSAVMSLLLQDNAGNRLWADIVRPFLEAHTVTYRLTINTPDNQSQAFNGKFMMPGKLQHDIPGEVTQIIDLELRQALMLDHRRRIATTLTLGKRHDIDSLTTNRFLEIRRHIQHYAEKHHNNPEPLRTEQDKGQNWNVYHFHKAPPEMYIWVDPQTQELHKIEYVQKSNNGMPMHFIMTDIRFNVQFDESAFSLAIPEGYAIIPYRPDPINQP